MRNNISELNVSEDWKNVFYNIQKYCSEDSIFEKTNEEFIKLDVKERQDVYRNIHKVRIMFLCILFGPLYYLFKGMWLKSLVFLLVALAFAIIATIFDMPDIILKGIYLFLDIYFAIMAPYSYYRLKVLNTQW